MDKYSAARIYQPQVEPFDLDYYRELKRASFRSGPARRAPGLYFAQVPPPELNAYERFHVQLRTIANRDMTDTVLVGQSAAFAWGLPLPAISEQIVLMRCHPGPRNGSDFVLRATGLETSRRSIAVSGCAVLDKIESAVDSAALVTQGWAVAMFDRVLNTAPLPLENGPFAATARREVNKTDIASVIAHAKSTRAQDRLRAALDMANGLAESADESRARVITVVGGLEDPELQVALYDDDGSVARVALLLRKSRIVLELAGTIKHTEPSNTEPSNTELSNAGGPDSGEIAWSGKRREDRIRALGLSVVRVVGAELTHSERLLDKLRQAGALDHRDT